VSTTAAYSQCNYRTERSSYCALSKFRREIWTKRMFLAVPSRETFENPGATADRLSRR
jgi:hypothetical protein